MAPVWRRPREGSEGLLWRGSGLLPGVSAEGCPCQKQLISSHQWHLPLGGPSGRTRSCLQR
eukprot:11549005-Alexandrium_andersonii.AAC.1